MFQARPGPGAFPVQCSWPLLSSREHAENKAAWSREVALGAFPPALAGVPSPPRRMCWCGIVRPGCVTHACGRLHLPPSHIRPELAGKTLQQNRGEECPKARQGIADLLADGLGLCPAPVPGHRMAGIGQPVVRLGQAVAHRAWA